METNQPDLVVRMAYTEDGVPYVALFIRGVCVAKITQSASVHIHFG